MKFIWEPGDVIVGRRILHYEGLEEFMIGFDPSAESIEANYVLISLCNGMIFLSNKTRKALVDWLNDSFTNNKFPGPCAYKPKDLRSNNG